MADAKDAKIKELEEQVATLEALLEEAGDTPAPAEEFPKMLYNDDGEHLIVADKKQQTEAKKQGYAPFKAK